MRATFFTLVSSCLFAVACGGAQDTSLLDGGGGSDGGGGNDGNPIDTGTNCDVSHCATIPDGFRAVRLSDGKAPCPGGWTSTNVVTNPVATPDACSCACNVTKDPDCNAGNITRFLDDTTSATCGSQATTFTANNGGCTIINGGNLFLNHAHYAVDAPPSTGGTCQYDPTLDPKKVSGTPALVCAPPASCVGAICDGAVCIAHDGDATCPSDFPTKTVVGDSATATCATCTGGACVVAGTCTGNLAFFTDTQCTVGEVDFTADTTCKTNPATNQGPYTAYSYKGSLKSSACSGPAPTSAATAALDKSATVCCKN